MNEKMEQFSAHIGEMQKMSIGFFRYHNDTEVHVVIDITDTHVVAVGINSHLSTMSSCVPKRMGILTPFEPGENVYTLRTKDPAKLQKYLDSTRHKDKAALRQKGGSYMAIST